MSPARLIPLMRVGFVCYVIVLVGLTHWPRLELPIDVIERPDLVAHFVAFGLLNAALMASAFFGPWLSTRNIWLSTLISAVYAPINELTQSLPGVNRHTSALDAAANLVGVGAVAAGALLLERIRQRAGARAVDDPSS